MGKWASVLSVFVLSVLIASLKSIVEITMAWTLVKWVTEDSVRIVEPENVDIDMLPVK